MQVKQGSLGFRCRFAIATIAQSAQGAFKTWVTKSGIGFWLVSSITFLCGILPRGKRDFQIFDRQPLARDTAVDSMRQGVWEWSGSRGWLLHWQPYPLFVESTGEFIATSEGQLIHGNASYQCMPVSPRISEEMKKEGSRASAHSELSWLLDLLSPTIVTSMPRLVRPARYLPT